MDRLEQAAAELSLPPLGEEADWLGRLNKVIRDLSAMRKTVLDELDGPTAGRDYRVSESRSAKRTYNTARILADFAGEGWALRDLLDADAVRLAWRWTELRRAYEQANVPLTVAHHEVEDLGDVEESPIGEVWKSAYKVEGI